ncbi:PVC-type heme-binding CxxCH protein [Limnoglobus roseus]|uniref:Putative beta-propeller-type glycoside hydrolase n=1 Tax=Limnoglobus roseus TaxID=2598579 RepID=A0A5C1APF6_9BACT|nr:PVC-type heme-binding CxxCH protein [Limnoglobus roseus]QEL20037.1 putative beta-propeller-type glycoside hydrolase [Limnoglobus roseus]
MFKRLLPLLAVLLLSVFSTAADPPPLNILFLGDGGHHLPAARFRQVQPELAKRNVTLTYTEKVSDLNLSTLNKYDGLMIFANHTDWQPENEKALIAYVESGKGFIPLHCASYCFIKSQPYIDLVGAQFRSHTTGVFRVTDVAPDHPIMKGFQSFESWDETYTHFKHNEKDRTVLEVRTADGVKEPWTWVRTQGQGRVFYTAWGHDQRTWSHPGFIALVERGTRWACNKGLDEATVYVDRPKMTEFAKDAKPFEFQPATLPYYTDSKKWGTQGEPIKTMQKPLPAEESVKNYVTPVDFEMKPFVTEEKLGGGKPIAMCWDERGRLWLSITYDYPNEMKPEGEGRDKIVVCEDTDGDGVCDTVTTFAEKLSIPTSILNVHGGLLVHQAPHTLFLKDTDGDGKADVRQVLFTGWGTNDTHAGPSNLRYGFDNWVYGMCGYSGFNGTVNDEKVKFGQGLYRMKIEKAAAGLKVSKLEFLRSTNNNSWGVGFNEKGELFGSTANNCPLVHLTIPNRYFEKVRGLTPGALQNIAYDNHVEPVVKDYRQVDWHGGFTAGAGCEVYTARTYPPEYWNKVAFISEPTGHLTAAMVLQPNGSSYTARYGWNLCASRDDWAAPIDARVGPDGHVWVIDWYNIIVQHNPTPQGYKTGKGNAYEIPLRDKKYGRIYRVVYTKAKPEPRVNLKDATPEQLAETLKHHNLAWRLHAQRLLVESGKSVENLKVIEGKVALERERLKSNSLPERLQAFLRIADEQPSAELGQLLATALGDATTYDDPALSQALTIAAAVHDIHFLTAVTAKPALSAADLRVVEFVAKHYASTAKGKGVSQLLLALDGAKSADVAGAIVNGLSAGSAGRSETELTADAHKALGSLLGKVSPTARGRLLKLSSAWGVRGLDAQLAELSKGLFATLADEKAGDESRSEAARQIIEFQPDSDDAAAKLVAAVTPKSSAAFAASIFETLAKSQAKNIGPAVVAKLKDLSPTVRPIALQVVLGRQESAKAFLDSVEKGELRFDLLALDQKTALASHPVKEIAERAKKLLAMGGGLPDANRQKVIEDMKPLLAKTGDVGSGKKVFVAQCAKCHKHGGEGNTIGPDLTGFGIHPKEEILIHVLDPSRSVEGNYKAYTANLLDGRTVTGLLASETKTSVELIDAENKRHALIRDDLETLKESPKSLMPEGFEKTIKPEEFVDLLEFLTQKGKFVPIPLDKFATVVSTKGMFNSEDDDAERLIFKDWKPKEFNKVPFYLVDPNGDKQKNAILLYSTSGNIPPKMPKSVTLPCNTPAKAIHLLSGVAGWASPYGEKGSVSLIVRLNYADGKSEDHELKNGVHVADYIRRVDVPESQFAFPLRGQQIRYLSVSPKRPDAIKSIELVKGADSTAPVVMAVTIETP